MHPMICLLNGCFENSPRAGVAGVVELVAMTTIQITEFSDPGCPWAWSAEPFRRRLMWLYGDAIAWKRRMVVLADSPEEYLDKGFTPDRLSSAFEMISHEHGMPIDTSLRDRMAATAPACRAVVAARLNAPDAEAPLLRALRVRTFAGEHLDDESTRAGAARDAGIDPAELEAWMATEDVERVLDEDRHAARHPTPAALAQDDRLASWEGGRRYTCPSYEIVALDGGRQIDVPGFQPFPAYEVAIANVAPQAQRRDAPTSVLEVLEWAGEPLATREVAVVCGLSDDAARQELGRVATERHLGYDGLWSPA
jgi:predicted DsbA family dithiol-disulfide isomerase